MLKNVTAHGDITPPLRGPKILHSPHRNYLIIAPDWGVYGETCTVILHGSRAYSFIAYGAEFF